MLEDYLKSSVTAGRLRASPVAPHIDAFADWLNQRGHTAITINLRLVSLASWAEWMESKKLALSNATAGVATLTQELSRGRIRYARGPNDDSRVAASLFVSFLRERGVISQVPKPPSATDRCPILAEFRCWMRKNRGLRNSSIDTYEVVVVDLLTRLGDEPSSYEASTLRAFVLDRAKPHGVWRAKGIANAVRSYVRFLAATGQCKAALIDAVPSYSSWNLSSTPRYIEPGDVEKVLDACTVDNPHGLRDSAVMLLLARLGLRAGDVADLRLEDVDWKNAQVAVSGKGRRREWLPLPQDVGDALLRYVLEARPSIETDHVFAKVNAPRGPLTRASVTHVARSALRRAGVTAPVNGAHAFRHSAATAMLRQGASLASIGAVLRHRSPSSTAHYAKVDIGLLEEVAQPWPEVKSC